MANPHKGEVAFAAGGKTYTLVYNTNALCELEEETGRGFTDIMLEFQAWATPTGDDGKPADETPEQIAARVKSMRLGLVRAVFWAGLREHHEQITVKQAGNLMTEVGGMLGAITLISRGFTAMLPAVDNDEGREAAAPPHPPQPDSHTAAPAGTGPAS